MHHDEQHDDSRRGQRGGEPRSGRGAGVGAATSGALHTFGEAARAAAGLTSQGAAAARSGTARLTSGAALPDVRGAANSLTEVLEGVVEDVRERGGEVVDALAGRRRPRRWPWAVGAAAAGAAAGAGVALLVRGLVGQDAPGAQEPDQLRAVVDPRPPAET